jgi:uncharacterized protein (DUF2147 family)
MTPVSEAEVEAAAKIIDPSAWSDLAKEMWRPGAVEKRQRSARNLARAALTAAAQVREKAAIAEKIAQADKAGPRQPLMPIYGATEDQGEDVLGIRKGEG